MRLAVVVLAALVLATPAQADYRYPGQRTAHDPTLDAMLAAAGTYWDRLGVPPACPETVLDVADLTSPDRLGDLRGRAYSPLLGDSDCRIVLDAYYAGQYLARMHSPWRDRFDRRWHAAHLCALVVHEEGHVRGLPHGDRYQVMRRDDVRISRWEDLPHECRVVARRIIRR